MKILVSGSHGLIGKALISSLTREGNEVLRLVRRERIVGSPEVEWDPTRGSIDGQHLEGVDAVVHLAGESIAEGRWDHKKKRRIRESRVQGTKLLTDSLVRLTRPPGIFLSASAIGFYGNRGDEILTETSNKGNDFLSDVCADWENATQPAIGKGIRVVNLRFGVILSTAGGALTKMLPPFRMGIGGRVGSGQQWMSWIALEDVIDAIEFALATDSLTGPVNIVAPNPVRNAAFTKELGAALSRPTLFPIPAFGARLAFGEMADALLLSSQRVDPARLKEHRFEFKYPTLNSALSHALRKE